MGLGVRLGLLLFALLALAVGGWIVAVPILAYLFLVPVLRRGGKRRAGSAPPRSRLGLTSAAIGGFFVLLSVVAFFSGGTFSPVVFLSAGLALLLWGRVPVRISSMAVPVEDSIMLRSRLNPFRWITVAEAKVSTRDLEGALSGHGGRLLLLSDPAPRVLLAFSTVSLGRHGAEERLIGMVRSTARGLAPLGVYLLPLEGADAASATDLRSIRVRLHAVEGARSVSSLDFGAAAADAEHGFVTSLAFYSRTDGAARATSLLSAVGERSSGRLTLREFLHEALSKVGAPHPDRYAAFLSSMAATEGETLGQRLTQAEAKGGQAMLVTSVGAPQVELTRAQLQAITQIYE